MQSVSLAEKKKGGLIRARPSFFALAFLYGWLTWMEWLPCGMAASAEGAFTLG